MKPDVRTYLEDKDFTVKLELMPSGEMFVHVDVHNWNHLVLARLREEFKALVGRLEMNGWEWLCVRAKASDKVVKFWNLIEPLTDTEPFSCKGVDYIAGAWNLEELSWA